MLIPHLSVSYKSDQRISESWRWNSKAFRRSRQIKTPEHLLPVVLGYCGLNQVRRETAGNFTLLEETERCVPVRVQVNGQFIEGYVQVCRLPPVPAAEARRRVRAQPKHDAC